MAAATLRVMPAPIVHFLMTDHALESMERRGLDRLVVADVMMRPQQRLDTRPGRAVLQSIVELPETRYLVRVVVDTDRTPAEVVTAYRTSKITKYWSSKP